MGSGAPSKANSNVNPAPQAGPPAPYNGLKQEHDEVETSCPSDSPTSPTLTDDSRTSHGSSRNSRGSSGSPPRKPRRASSGSNGGVHPPVGHLQNCTDRDLVLAKTIGEAYPLWTGTDIDGKVCGADSVPMQINCGNCGVRVLKYYEKAPFYYCRRCCENGQKCELCVDCFNRGAFATSSRKITTRRNTKLLEAIRTQVTRRESGSANAFGMFETSRPYTIPLSPGKLTPLSWPPPQQSVRFPPLPSNSADPTPSVGPGPTCSLLMLPKNLVALPVVKRRTAPAFPGCPDGRPSDHSNCSMNADAVSSLMELQPCASPRDFGQPTPSEASWMSAAPLAIPGGVGGL